MTYDHFYIAAKVCFWLGIFLVVLVAALDRIDRLLNGEEE